MTKSATRFILFLMVVCSALNFAEAQNKLSKKEIRRTKLKAEALFDKGEFFKSLELFEKLLKTDSLSPYYNYHAGLCKFNLKHYRKDAMCNLQLAHNRISYDVHYYMGNLYHFMGDLDAALREYNFYLEHQGEKNIEETEVKRLIEKCYEAKRRIASPSRVEITNMGNSLNSEYSDYVPIISTDGKTLFFTSRRPGSTGNKINTFGEYYEDIYQCTVSEQGNSEPKSIGEPINTNDHDACVSLSAEGHTMLIYRASANLLGGDIYECHYDGGKWTAPVALDKEVDSEQWIEASACYSSDGRTIYFSSNRPGGLGGKDIYEVVKQNDGKWGKARNLGPDINTPYDEDAPFLHPNGKQLFFSSTGRENMGGYDVFVSVKGNEGNWKKAVNMGYPLNTVDDDIYFVVTGDGSTGYISSDRPGGFGEADIYKVKMHENDSLFEVHSGFVRSEAGSGLDAKISLIDKADGKVVSVFKSNHLTGRFAILMDETKDYTVLVEAEGYVSEKIENYHKGPDFEIKLKKKQ